MVKIVIEQVMSDLFRAEIPLPRNPLKATNSYIIKSNSRNLIIDTGMNREECKQAMSEVVRELDIDLHKTDFFITHLHADHVGLVNELAASDAAIYFNQLDADVLNYKNLWQMACVMAARNGFPAGDVDRAVNAHPGQRYSPHQPVNFKMITEEDTIVCGDFELQCIVTPGHTDGHTCLYEPNRKMFFSGDHILGDITPNISTLSDEGNPLADYLSSLDKVYQMPIELVLPGHRRIVNDCRKRITELKENHFRRFDEVLEILRKKGPGSAFYVASHMVWDLVAENWEAFPIMQKWFASGEALAHLRYLEEESAVEQKVVDDILIFSAV